MAESPSKTSSEADTRKRGFFGRIVLFFREMVSELKKVVRPTRKELVNYTSVVLVFVVMMMLIVLGLDFLFGHLAGTVFGGEPIWPLW